MSWDSVIVSILVCLCILEDRGFQPSRFTSDKFRYIDQVNLLAVLIIHSLLPLHILGKLLDINICGGKPCIIGMSRKACILETIVNMYIHLAVSTKTFVKHVPVL